MWLAVRRGNDDWRSGVWTDSGPPLPNACNTLLRHSPSPSQASHMGCCACAAPPLCALVASLYTCATPYASV